MNLIVFSEKMYQIEAEDLDGEIMRKISSTDLTNIRGPPGTGKSQKVIKIVNMLLEEGKKVILTTETR